MKITPTSHTSAEETIAGWLPRVPLHSHNLECSFALYLLSDAERAGLQVQAPAVRPVVVDAATEVGARLHDLDRHGLLEALSSYQLTRVLRRPYLGGRQPRLIEEGGWAMLAEADRADAITVIVTAPPLPGDPVSATREVRLSRRLEEIDATYDSLAEVRRRARLDHLMRAEALVLEPAWAER